MNPLFNMLKQVPILNEVSQIGQMYNTFKNSNNPMAFVNQIAQSNPQMKPIAQALQNGANPQQLFYQECQKRGIDPQQFLNNLQGNIK